MVVGHIKGVGQMWNGLVESWTKNFTPNWMCSRSPEYLTLMPFINLISKTGGTEQSKAIHVLKNSISCHITCEKGHLAILSFRVVLLLYLSWKIVEWSSFDLSFCVTWWSYFTYVQLKKTRAKQITRVDTNNAKIQVSSLWYPGLL